MTLLILTNQLDLGGAERVALRQSDVLRRAGWRVLVAATPGALTDEVHPKIGVAALPPPTPAQLIPSAVQLRRMRRLHGVRVVLAHSARAVLLARLAGWPRDQTFTVAHGWAPARLNRITPLLSLAGHVFAVSDELRAALVHRGLCDARVSWLPNLPPTRTAPQPHSRSRLRHALGTPLTASVAITVARLEPQKAPERAIEIAWRCPQTWFWWVGDGSLGPRLRGARLPPNLRLLGPRRDVDDLLGAADIYLHTSDWEGHCLAQLEAMRAGLPLVTTRVFGLRPLMDAHPDLVFAPQDVCGLAGAVRALSIDGGARAAIGHELRARLASFSRQQDPDGRLCRTLGTPR